ncbi:MAG: serine/threonine-protein kinase [Polyangiaceae bacterium]
MSEHRLALVEEQDSRDFLQTRVAQFGRRGALLSFLALPLHFHMPQGVLAEPHPAEADKSILPHLLATVALYSVALLNGTTPRSERFIYTTEAIGLISSSLLYCWMGSYIPKNGDFILLLAMSLMAFARAALVPSSTLRTTLITAGCGVGFLVAIFAPQVPLGPDCMAPIGRLVYAWMWWALVTALAAGTSSVIYGLREQVREARRVGQYVLEEKIGEGAMGVVYKASHALLRRPTAVKLLRPELAGGNALARFEHEVRLTATLTHPNTITVFDYGRTPDGTLYYAMELLEGANLEEIVTRVGPLPPERVVDILRQVASALVEAHAAGLVHRDIKPANIFLCEHTGTTDVVKVLDFGIVRQLRAPAGALTDRRGVGTPHYISPEAISAPDTVSAQSDLYSLGAVGYYLLTGRPVFDASTPIEVWTHHLCSAPIPFAERIDTAIPRELERVLFSCLSKSPQGRPQSARELIRLLDELQLERWDDAKVEAWWATHRDRIHSVERTQAEHASNETVLRTFAMDVARRSAAE